MNQIWGDRLHKQDEVWVFEINGSRKTVKDLHDAYSGYLLLIKPLLEQELKRILLDSELWQTLEAEKNSSDKELASVLRRYPEEDFAKQYMDIELVANVAERSGFSNLPRNKTKLKFLYNYYLANLYIFEKLDLSSINPSEAEIAAELQYIKKNAMDAEKTESEARAMARSNAFLRQAIARQEALMKTLRLEKSFQVNKTIEIKALLENERK